MAAPRAGQHLAVDPGLRQRMAALQAQRHQQVQRQELGDGRRHFEVGLQRPGEHTEHEEQDGGVKQALHVAGSSGRGS
jgi:hypothetical protein